METPGAARPANRKKEGRIFINYRREDAGAVAGRLSDTLEQYFGEGRVFRDIEGIAGGAAFDRVIGETLDASDAVIVLIGDRWLSAAEPGGGRRIDNPEDWVAREIEATLKKGTPIFPVLVEEVQMPRADELPEAIRPLSRLNAVRIGDQRWSHDTQKLAQVISLDIPGSLAERKLTLVNRLISIALFLSVFLTLGGLTVNLINEKLAELDAPEAVPRAFSGAWFARVFPEPGLTGNKAAYFHFGASAITFITVLFCVVGLALFARLVDAGRRAYVYAAVFAGGGLTLLFFVLVLPTATEFEPVVNVFGSTVTAFAMLALMSLSGLKAK
ncbi:MAG: toll/interleukin-1 receptor domain-containing protein [Verrucomicrobiae bacterium]|nr:toll/interleukin-1 receptor domain-containing protein [Verrucomicrobiae bacterium]